jgi:hypothetical protein
MNRPGAFFFHRRSARLGALGGSAMRRFGLLLAACSALLAVSNAKAADPMDYSVTLKGDCQYQILMGWDTCADNAVYTLFKNGKYLFQFVDGHQNSYAFSGRKDRQVDPNNLYSNIDTLETTIGGKKVVDAKAMGGCNTKITPAGDKFVYIDCSVSNSKNVLFKFRISNVTDVQRMLTQ